MGKRPEGEKPGVEKTRGGKDLAPSQTCHLLEKLGHFSCQSFLLGFLPRTALEQIKTWGMFNLVPLPLSGGGEGGGGVGVGGRNFNPP